MNENANRVQLDPTKLQHIIESLVTKLKPQKMILFGSRAEWRAYKESDVDLLVVLDAPIDLDRGIRFELTSQLSREVGLRIQLIPMAIETYEETKGIIGGIAYPATKYGVVIYENS